MIVHVKVISTHHLEDAARNRRYVFRAIETEQGKAMEVERWVRLRCEYRREMSMYVARRLWSWLRKLGYAKW